MKKEIINASIQFVMEDGYEYSEWKEQYGLINEGYILRIPIKGETGVSNSIGTYKLINESDDKVYKIGEKDNHIEIEFSCEESDYIYSLSAMYEKLESAKKDLEVKLHKYNINQCELVLIMYLNTYAVIYDDSEVFEDEQVQF